MKWQELAAWKLAEELDVIRAKAATRSSRQGTWMGMYDPHAATELARLIYNRMTNNPAKQRTTDMTSIATFTIKKPGAMTADERKKIVVWLRYQATCLLKKGKEYNDRGAFRARYYGKEAA